MNWIVIMCIGLVIVAIMAMLWYKGKKKWVLQTIYSLMITAEGLLGSDTGQEKLDMVMDGYSRKILKLPFLPRWILEKVLPAEKLETYINNFLPAINDMFREKYHIENNFIEKVIETGVKTGKDIMLKKALDRDFNGDQNLIDNISLIDISDEVDISVNKEKRGLVKGYAELETNFKEAQLKAGVQALYKF